MIVMLKVMMLVIFLTIATEQMTWNTVHQKALTKVTAKKHQTMMTTTKTHQMATKLMMLL